jgi:hypothetical protein
MPYARQYSLHEVHEILCKSERRTRPKAAGGGGQRGHAIAQHGDMRENILDKRYWTITLKYQTIEEGLKYGPIPPVVMPPSKPVGSDSRFLRRLDLIRAVAQALNSPKGQTELSMLRAKETVSTDRWGSRRKPPGTPSPRSAPGSRRRPSRRTGRRPTAAGSRWGSSSWSTASGQMIQRARSTSTPRTPRRLDERTRASK